MPPGQGSDTKQTELVWNELPREHGGPRAAPRLKADGGAQVRLRTVTARVVIVPPLSFTELELSFADLTDGAATFEVGLPPGAAVSRFAVQEHGSWVNAKLADAEQTKAALGSAAALPDAAELRAPGHFVARVLKGSAAPQLLLGYAEVLPNSHASYRLAVAGLPELDALHVSVDVKGETARRYELSRAGFVPDRDFVLDSTALGSGNGALLLQAGRFVALRLPPETTASTQLTFLIDTSQSQAVPLAQLCQRLVELSERLAQHAPSLLLTVIGFDQDIHPIVVGARAPLSMAQLAPLRDLERLGGTDLTFAVAATIAAGFPHHHLVMLSDFQNTVSSGENAFNIDHSALARLDYVLRDAHAEQAFLEQQAQQGGGYGYPGVRLLLSDETEQLAKRLLEPTPKQATLRVEGASWTSVSAARESAPEVGQDFMVLAELAPGKPFKLFVNDQDRTPITTNSEPSLAELLKHVVGQARLDRGLYGFVSRYQEEDHSAALKAYAEAPSSYGVLSAQSSFFVRGSSGRALAGRVIEAVSTPGLTRYSVREPAAAPATADQCPDLIGMANTQYAQKGCPPLLVSFAQDWPKITARVAFTPGSALPNLALSPHLAQLADLLSLRQELAKVDVRASSKLRAESVIRYLVERGIGPERLRADVLAQGLLAARKPTAECKSAGEDVLFEVRQMTALPGQPSPVKTVSAKLAPAASRLAQIQSVLRAGRIAGGRTASLEEARRTSERWISEQPSNPAAYVALGDSLSALGNQAGAARAYGSLFELEAPGAGLAGAAAVRLNLLAPSGPRQRERDAGSAAQRRLSALAMQTYRRQWQEHPEHIEGARAYAYAELRAENYREAFGMALEAAKHSSLVKTLELPLFAQLYAAKERNAAAIIESFLPAECLFPLKADVLGAILSWEDVDSDLELTVTSVESGMAYDSVLSERTPGAALKWLPLPKDDAAYPIKVSVRANHLSKHGFAFGNLRVLNTLGKGRIFSDERPFLLTAEGEALVVLEEAILQRPQ